MENKIINNNEIERLSVQDIVVDDVPSILELLSKSSREMYLGAGYTEQEYADKYKDSTSVESVKKTIENIFPIGQNEKYLVVKDDGQVIGFCYAERGDEKNVLNAIYLLPQYQGKGVGKKLWTNMSSFLDLSKETYLTVFAANTKAIDFYKKLGFVKTGKIIEEDSRQGKNGTVVQEIEMVLRPDF